MKSFSITSLWQSLYTQPELFLNQKHWFFMLSCIKWDENVYTFNLIIDVNMKMNTLRILSRVMMNRKLWLPHRSYLISAADGFVKRKKKRLSAFWNATAHVLKILISSSTLAVLFIVAFRVHKCIHSLNPCVLLSSGNFWKQLMKLKCRKKKISPLKQCCFHDGQNFTLMSV